MYDVLMVQGVEFGRVVQEIKGESAASYKAKMLESELSAALIPMTRPMHDRSRRSIEALTARMTPQYNRIFMKFWETRSTH